MFEKLLSCEGSNANTAMETSDTFWRSCTVKIRLPEVIEPIVKIWGFVSGAGHEIWDSETKFTRKTSVEHHCCWQKMSFVTFPRHEMPSLFWPFDRNVERFPAMLRLYSYWRFFFFVFLYNVKAIFISKIYLLCGMFTNIFLFLLYKWNK